MGETYLIRVLRRSNDIFINDIFAVNTFFRLAGYPFQSDGTQHA